MDLDNDGYRDLLFVNNYGPAISWYKNNGDGTFIRNM
ncbi:MAG: VCBS repeat-containing protein [Sphingobacteriales bacterium]|nr:VCBS repeat-containing protein [Sphingobacteriales bacterium]